MKKGLGKGLDALFTDNDIDIIDEKQIQFININDIEPNKSQPRKFFDKEKLEELASSLKEHGVLQPILVKTIDNNRYQIISGERRWRAARVAQITELPVIVKDLDDKTALEIALIENLQREDLNIVEEAKGYKILLEQYEFTQEQLGQAVGKSRPVISNALRILSLPEKVLDYVLEGTLTSGHARALLPLQEKYSEKDFILLVEDIIKKNATVRDVENLIKTTKNGTKKPKKTKQTDLYISGYEKSISEIYGGRKVKITSTRSRGKIELEFYNKDDMDNLLKLLISNNEID